MRLGKKPGRKRRRARRCRRPALRETAPGRHGSLLSTLRAIRAALSLGRPEETEFWRKKCKAPGPSDQARHRLFPFSCNVSTSLPHGELALPDSSTDSSPPRLLHAVIRQVRRRGRPAANARRDGDAPAARGAEPASDPLHRLRCRRDTSLRGLGYRRFSTPRIDSPPLPRPWPRRGATPRGEGCQTSSGGGEWASFGARCVLNTH